jgi:hypothetical protein
MQTYKLRLVGMNLIEGTNRSESWAFAFDAELETPPVAMRQLVIGRGRNAIVATTTKVMPTYARVVSPQERDKQEVLRKLRASPRVKNIVEKKS